MTSMNLNVIQANFLEIPIDLGRYQQEAQEAPAQRSLSLSAAEVDGPPDVGLVGVARRLLREGDSRREYFPQFVISDPIWPILLDLYIHTAEDRRVCVSDACVAARAPSTTALRHIGELVEHGAVERTPDARDRRRTYLKLTAQTYASVSRYLASIDALMAAGDIVTARKHKRQA